MNPHQRPPSSFLHPQRTAIKLCGFTREVDVDAAVAAGADAIGFVLYPRSPRYVTPERAAALAARLPAHVRAVLLFVNEDAIKIIALFALFSSSNRPILQFHGDETPEFCADVAARCGAEWWRAARIPLAGEGDFDLLEFAQRHSHASAILLDALVDGYGGGGHRFNWSHLPAAVPCPLVLSGGLTPANVTDGILHLRPRCDALGVDVSSGIEARNAAGQPLKGIKDADLMNQFVAAVRAADAALASPT